MGRTRSTSGSRGSLLLGRALRLRRGHRSYQEMADRSAAPPLAGRVEPLSASYLHKLESGKRLPSIEALRTLSHLYGLSTAHMLRLIESERLAEVEPKGGADVEALVSEATDAIRLGDYQAGFAAAFRAEEEADTPSEQAVAAHNKALCLWKLGLSRAAVEVLVDQLARPALEPRFVRNAYYALAAIHLGLDNLRLAELYAREGLGRSREAAGPREAALFESLLGNILVDRAARTPERAERLCREACRHYESARKAFLELGEKGQAAHVLANIGAARRVEGNRLVAFERLREAVEACRDADHRRGLAYALKEIGVASRAAADWAGARKSLIDAERIAGAAGYVDLQFQALVHLVEGAEENGEAPAPMMRRARGLLPHLEARSLERERFEARLREQSRGEAAGGAS